MFSEYETWSSLINTYHRVVYCFLFIRFPPSISVHKHISELYITANITNSMCACMYFNNEIQVWTFKYLFRLEELESVYNHQTVKMTSKGFFVFQNIYDCIVNVYKI